MLTQLRTLLPPPGCTPRPAAASHRPIFEAHNFHGHPLSPPHLHAPALEAWRVLKACRQNQCSTSRSPAPFTASEHNGQRKLAKPTNSSHHLPTDPKNQSGQPLGAEKGRRTKRGRLDEVCMGLAPHLSRNVVQSYILQGKVRVDGRVVEKAGTAVPLSAKVEIDAEEPKYVCRAGHKLEAGLAAFGINPKGLVCLDSGVSTGGFTDCLLQQGAAHVYGIDVAYGQVANKVRQDERVTLLERFNVRYLTPNDIPAKVDLATLDLSFISVLKVLPAVVSVMRGSPTEHQDHSAMQQQQQQQQEHGHRRLVSPSLQQLPQHQAESALGAELQGQQEAHEPREGQQPQAAQQSLGAQRSQEVQQPQRVKPQQEVQQSQKEAQQPQAAWQLQEVQQSHGVQLSHRVQQSQEEQPAAHAQHAAEQQQLLQGQRPPAQLLVLIKPQFEAGRGQVCSGGVVRDPQVHLEVLTRITEGVEALGFGCQGIIVSPLKGDKSGNTEFLAHYVRGMPTRTYEVSLLTAEGHKRKKARKAVDV